MRGCTGSLWRRAYDRSPARGEMTSMHEEATVDFGRLLRERRLATGLTQEALAARAGMGVRSLQALERGESKPLRDTLQRLVVALGLTPEDRAPFAAAAGPTPRRRTAAASAPAGTGPDLPPRATSVPRVHQLTTLPM